MRATGDLAPRAAQVAQVAQRVQQAPMAVVATVVLVVRQARRAMGATVLQVLPKYPLVAQVDRVVTQARMQGWVAQPVRQEWELAKRPVQARRELLAPMLALVATAAMAGQVTQIHLVMAVMAVLVVRVVLWVTEELVGLVELALQQARALLRRVEMVAPVVTAALPEMAVSVVLVVQQLQRAQMHRLQVVKVEMAAVVLRLGPAV